MRKLLYLFALVAIVCNAQAQDVKTVIIPTPHEVTYTSGKFILKNLGNITIENEKDEELLRLAEMVKDSLTFNEGKKGNILLRLSKSAKESGSYQVNISKKNILIEGADYRGVFYGIQSFMQLADQAKDGKLACQNIKDAPGFEWRGLHIDVARTFYPEAQMKKILRMMAYYKLNTLHWHLTDDQGWRIQSKKYPKLHETGSFGGPYSVIGGQWLGEGNGQGNGMFYKRKVIKRILKYAKSLYIDVVPEIDMPAHAAAFLAAFPELKCTSKDTLPNTYKGVNGLTFNYHNKKTTGLKQYQWDASREVCIGKEATFEVLYNVFDEVMDLFPSKYIHIGGDEAYKHGWQKCAHCQRRMKEEGLEDVKKLQSYFIKRMEKHIIAKGKKMIGWNEILQGGINESTTVMFWNGHKHDEEIIHSALENGNDMIMTPSSYLYFDNVYARRSEKDVYKYNPMQYVPEKYEDKILGMQGCVWGEYGRLDSGGQVRQDAMENFERMIFPRLLPLAELAWNKKKKVEDKEFFEKVEKHVEILKGKKNISIGEVKMTPWW